MLSGIPFRFLSFPLTSARVQRGDHEIIRSGIINASSPSRPILTHQPREK